MKTINVENLSKSYHGKKVVDDVSFTVYEGEIFGLLGANGAGKSTTIECMLGVRKANAKHISILDMDPIEDRKKLFERVGVQFQETNYQDKITVKEMCEETASFYKKSQDYNDLLKQFGLEDKCKNLVSELSGGQRQRLFIVLALLPSPDILFLDELTTGLDAQARRQVWKRIHSLKETGMSIFITSHFMDEVEMLCDRIGILKEGKLIFCGRVEEAIEKSPYSSLEETYLWFTNEEELYVESL